MLLPFDIFGPQPDTLLRQISKRVDDRMLEKIAEADYGRDVEKHLAQLRRIRDEGAFDIPMLWHPEEVLELVRWSQPDYPDWNYGASCEEGHWIRAFACAALLRAAGEFEHDYLRVGWNQTLIQLIESLRALRADLDEPAAALLAWLILRFDAEREEELEFFGVGLLWFALHLKPPVPDATIIAVAEWIADRERAARKRSLSSGDTRWLLGNSSYDQCNTGWYSLGSVLEGLDLAGRSGEARDWIRLIGSELVGAWRHRLSELNPEAVLIPNSHSRRKPGPT